MSKRNRKQSYVCDADEVDDDINSIARNSPRGSVSSFAIDGPLAAGAESEQLRTGLDLDPLDGGHTFNFNFSGGDALGTAMSGLATSAMKDHDLCQPLPSSSSFPSVAAYSAPQPNYIVKEVHHEGPTKVLREVEHIHHHHETQVPVTQTVIQQVPVKQYVPVNIGTGYDSDSSDSSDDTHYSSSRRKRGSSSAQPNAYAFQVPPLMQSSSFSADLSADLDFERLIDQASNMAVMERNYELDSMVSMSDKMMSSKLAELRERNRTANLKVAQMEAEGRKRESMRRDMNDLRGDIREKDKLYADRVKEIIQMQHENAKLQNKVAEVEEEKEDEVFALKKKHRSEEDNLRLQLEMKEDELEEQIHQQEAMQKHLNKLLGKGGRPSELGSRAKLINERVRDLQSELQKAEMRVEELRDRLDKQDRESNQVVAEREMIIEKQQRQIQAQQGNISTLAAKAQKVEQGVALVNGKEYNVFDVLQDNSKLEVEVENTKKKLATEEAAMAKLKKDLDLAKKGLLKQKGMIIQLGSGHQNQDAQIEQLKDMLQKMTAINQTLIKENSKIKGEFKKQRNEYMMLHKTSTQNAAELEQVRKSLGESQTREKSLRKDHNEAQMQLIEKEGLENQTKTLRAEIRKLKLNLKDCRTKIDEAQSREVDATMALDQLHEAKKILDEDLQGLDHQVTKCQGITKNLAGSNLWHPSASSAQKHTEVSG